MIDDSAPEFPGASEDQMASAGSLDPGVSQHGQRCDCPSIYLIDHSEFGLPLGFDMRCSKCGRMWKAQVLANCKLTDHSPE